jgi:hypothetical protein
VSEETQASIIIKFGLLDILQPLRDLEEILNLVIQLLYILSILKVISPPVAHPSTIVVLIVFIDGFIKPHTPGSLREPAQTYMFPSNWLTLPLSFGLLMSPWGGHSVFPNIYRDMRHPQKFNRAVKITFSFTVSISSGLPSNFLTQAVYSGLRYRCSRYSYVRRRRHDGNHSKPPSNLGLSTGIKHNHERVHSYHSSHQTSPQRPPHRLHDRGILRPRPPGYLRNPYSDRPLRLHARHPQSRNSNYRHYHIRHDCNYLPGVRQYHGLHGFCVVLYYLRCSADHILFEDLWKGD